MGVRTSLTISLLLVVLVSGCKTPSQRPHRTSTSSTTTYSSPDVQTGSSDFSPSSYSVYSIRQGDTLYSLAKKYGVSVDRLLAENAQIDNPSDIAVGQTILIPEKPGVDPPEDPGEYYAGSLTSSNASSGSPREVSRSSLHQGNPSARFWWPTAGRLTRKYGQKVRGFTEPGIGISAPAGTRVCASADGTVIVRVDERGSPEAGWANVVAIRHSGGFVSWYGLLGNVSVKEWQKVRQGQKIGTVGSRGELAYRLYRRERPVDPQRYLP